jgi:predicted SnoaL-like aldol condensation-catalyzing enzyme
MVNVTTNGVVIKDAIKYVQGHIDSKIVEHWDVPQRIP